MSGKDDLHETVARIPTEQRLTFALRPKIGSVMNAETVGKSLASICEIIALSSKEDIGDTIVALVGMTLGEDMSVTFDLAILPKERTP